MTNIIASTASLWACPSQSERRREPIPPLFPADSCWRALSLAIDGCQVGSAAHLKQYNSCTSHRYVSGEPGTRVNEKYSYDRLGVGLLMANHLSIVLVALVLVACFETPSISDYQTTIQCPGCLTIQVSRVIDGDTFESPAGAVRLFGVDTPEKGNRCFRQATKALRQLAGASVRVAPGPRARDPGGRLLYYVFTGNGNSIDEILVREGLALAWTRDGQHRDALVRLERGARRSGTGCLW